MAMNFPNSPATNSTYTVGSNTWMYDGEKWVLVATPLDIDDLGDVVITSAANGQLLEFDGSNWVNAVRPSNEPMGHENKADSVISFDEGTRTFSIAPVSVNYTVWCAGKRYVKTGTETVEIPDTSGLYYIYFSSSGVLSYRTSFFVWDTDAPTAYIYWNEVDNKAYFFADERHGITLDWATHEYLHRTRGAAIANGFGVSNYSIVGDGSSDAHAKFDLAGGTFFDEDLQVDIVHSNTPTANTWEQVLEGNAEIPVFYRLNNHWKKDSATEFAFKQGTSRPQFNSFSSPNWSTIDIDNNKFAISWIIATNNLNEPVIAIMGQASYNTVGEAEAALWEGLNLDGFPIVEFRPLHKVVFQGTNSFTNSVNAAIRGIYDLRRIHANGSTVPSTPVSDHGSMTGLSDDDHTQYLTDTRHNALDHSTAMGTVVLDDINDVTAPSPSSGDFLKWNGTAWVNDPINLGTDTVGDSDDVAEGTTNIYFTDSRARTALLADNNGTSSGIRLIAPNTGTVELISHEATRFVRVTSNAATGGGKIEIAGSAQVIAAPSIADPGDLSVAGSVTVGGVVVFEGATANDYETTLQVGDPTADRTITLPNATGTLAINGSIALGTDTTGGYIESLVAGTGITLTNNSGLEGAVPTVALSSGVVTSTGTFNSVTVDTYGRVTNGSSVPVVTTGDTGTVTSTMIANGTIVDEDISATAAIALSKLAASGASNGDLISFNGTTWTTSAPVSSSSITVSDTAPSPAEQGDLWYNSLTLDAYIYYSSAWVQLFNDDPLVTDLRDLTDVLIDGETYGQVLSYNGTEWANTSLVGISASSASNYTLVLTDMNKTIERDSSSANTVTIPLNSSVQFPIGTKISVYQYGTGKTQIIGDAGVTVRSNPGFYLSARYSVATLVKRAADEWILFGDLSAS
jgi:hypothetical protein